MMTRMTSVINQFTLLLSAVGGNPAAASAFFSSASFQPLTSASPILVTTLSVEPAGKSLEANEMPCLVRKSFVRSQSLNWDHGPTKIWNWQSVAATEILVFADASSSAGLT